VANGKVPKGLGHLFLHQTGTGHVDHNLPMLLDKTITRLLTGRGQDDRRVVGMEEQLNATAKDFLVA
jgi:hypothetical protein